MSFLPPLDPARFAAVDQSLLIRGIVYAVATLPLALFTLVWCLLTIDGIGRAKDDMTVLAGVIALFLGGVIPGVITAIVVWRAIANLRLRGRFTALHGALMWGRAGSVHDLARSLNLSPHEADATLRDAVGRGLFTSALAFVAQAPAITTVRASGSPALGAPPNAGGDWVGRTVRGVYFIEAPLGRGGMGAVFRARHLPTGAPCAFKILLASRYDAPDLLHRFEREATLSRSVTHPGLVRVDDFGLVEDGTPYLVMELLDGETLEERLARLGVLAWPDAARVTLAIGDALSAAHRVGFLHRDIKPSNIMLARSPRGERPVLVDFGLAKRVGVTAPSHASRLTSTGSVVGTPLYLSPEQARGEPLDERSDLYGLAVVTYEMLMGVPPFFDKTLAEVYARLLNEAAPSLNAGAPRFPPALDAALSRAMAKRREDRFASVAAFLATLRDLA
jgi:tRNA A-37 threonylcarbamoyl transferase component Bud32